jgi:hypothetical protein
MPVPLFHETKVIFNISYVFILVQSACGERAREKMRL